MPNSASDVDMEDAQVHHTGPSTSNGRGARTKYSLTYCQDIKTKIISHLDEIQEALHDMDKNLTGEEAVQEILLKQTQTILRMITTNLSKYFHKLEDLNYSSFQVFPNRTTSELKAFQEHLDMVVGIPKELLMDQWPVARAGFRTLLGVDMKHKKNKKSPRKTRRAIDGQQSGDEDDGMEVASIASHGLSSLKLGGSQTSTKVTSTTDRVRSILEQVGTGKKLPLGTEGLLGYLKSLTYKPRRFSCTKGSNESLSELWALLEDIHLAPLDQVSYREKIEAVFYFLEGEIEETIAPYRSVNDREGYFSMWTVMFNTYGGDSSEQNWFKDILSSGPQGTDNHTLGRWLITVSGLIMRLKIKGGQENALAAEAWRMIEYHASATLQEFVITIPRFYMEYRTISQYYVSDPMGTLREFSSYVNGKAASEAYDLKLAPGLRMMKSSVAPMAATPTPVQTNLKKRKREPEPESTSDSEEE